MEELIEAWRVNNRINLFLIDHISDEGMRCTLSKRGGRDVCRQFAHMHSVRVWKLQNWDKTFAEGLQTFETQDHPSKERLKGALSDSGAQIARFIEAAGKGETKSPGLKMGLGVSVGYFISHESHHRGSILLTLKQCGHRVDQRTQYAIWDWDKM